MIERKNPSLLIFMMNLHCIDLGLVEYAQALGWQEELVRQRCQGESEDTLLLLEHPPVFTLGRGGDERLTCHGRDVHLYLRSLEAVLIAVLAEYGLRAQRKDGITGVWVGEKKIASIGVGVRRWVTYHGFALNVDPDLSYFADIVPCGLPGVRMTSMAQQLARPVALAAVKAAVAQTFADYFVYAEMLWQKNLLTPNPELPILDPQFSTPGPASR